MTSKKQLIIIGIVFFLIVSLLIMKHNSDHVGSLHTLVIQIKKSAAEKFSQIKIESFNTPNPVFYDAASLPAPFKGIAIVAQSGSAISAENPLLSYPLSVLRFIGTLSQGSKMFAFVVAPDNVVYQLEKGDVVGVNQGVVIDIQPHQLEVIEKNYENGKTPTERLIMLQLKEEN